MNTAEIRRAAEALPLTVESLRALIGAAESFALAMVAHGLIGADAVQEICLDAFKACDDITAPSMEDVIELERGRATDWLITRDKEERKAA